MQKRIFVISPVRNIDKVTYAVIEKWVHAREAEGYKVHWPPRDTNQVDPIGLDICKQNREAIFWAGEVHIWLDLRSQGSLFDMGMTFAYLRDMRKKIVIINQDQIKSTPDKSFENVFLELAKAS